MLTISFHTFYIPVHSCIEEGPKVKGYYLFEYSNDHVNVRKIANNQSYNSGISCGCCSTEVPKQIQSKINSYTLYVVGLICLCFSETL